MLTRSTSLAYLYRECGWATLDKRLTFQNLCFMYRCVKGFCFGSLVILDVARCCLWLFTLYINIKIGKIVVKC